MENNQYYYDRNHYFYGKLMTVRDFESEQLYLNSKRRLCNRLLLGPGIVTGLDVSLIDNKNISLEAGMAIDYFGREIVVQEPVLKKLNVISGFEENEDKEELFLGIKYKEELTESTFSVVGAGKDSGVSQEYNRISESYELFLTPESPDEKLLGLDNLIYNTVNIYKKYGITIELRIPKYANPRSKTKVTVFFEKKNVQARVNYAFTLEGTLFKNNNKKNLEIEYQENEISAYKRVRKDYYIYCDAVSETITDVIIRGGSFSIEIGKELDILSDDIKQAITITSEPVRSVIINDYFSGQFENLISVKNDQEIYLAKFNLIHNQASYFIENFKKHPFKQYVLNNKLLDVLQKNNYIDNLESDFSENKNIIIQENNNNLLQEEKTAENIRPENILTAQGSAVITGLERINLGFYARVGRVFFSYEFIHGLGYGNVAVITALDNKEAYATKEPNLLMFGDNSLFHGEGVSVSAPKVSIGAVVDPNKGTLKLGIKLLEKTSAQFVDVRWWAFKPSNETKESEPLSEEGKVKVEVEPNTIKIEPLAQVRLSAKVTGTATNEVIWSISEEGGGTIDGNGLYTAPAKEGVYEVRATSAKFAEKYASAYIVVSTLN